MTIIENALQGVRAEWIAESTVGTPPSNPEWNKFSDYLDAGPGWSPPDFTSENNAVGSGDIVDITRGSEDAHEFTIEYWAQRPLIDKSANVNDPVAFPLTHDYQTEHTSHTIVWRREVTEGGADGAGYRVYTVAHGARPTSGTIPGDPGEESPQSIELNYEAEYGRSHRIDQPSSGTTLSVSSTDSGADDGDVDIAIEDDGAATTETITCGNSGGSTFDSIDAVRVSLGDPSGDISITDGSGTTFVTLQGLNTNGVDYDLGVPLLGTGSHASAIGNDPEQYLGLNTASSFGGNLISPDRIHQFDLSVDLDSDTNAQQGTRRPSIDIGPRTVTADADVASQDASTKQIQSFLQGYTGDLTYALGGSNTGDGSTDITLEKAQVTDTDDKSFGAGDANNIFAITLTAQDSDDDGSVVNLTNTV